MKKIILALMLFIPFGFVYATDISTEQIAKMNDRKSVILENCNDINQIWVNEAGKVKRIGLLAYDTGDTSLNSEIQSAVCTKLKEAKNIHIEYDENYTTKDSYNRDMVWVYIDNKLLQEELVSEGYGMINYVADDYSNIDSLCKKEAQAIKNKKGIWSLGATEKYCDSGIILEQDDKIENEKNNKKKLSKDTIIQIAVMLTAIILLVLTMIIKVKHEKK